MGWCSPEQGARIALLATRIATCLACLFGARAVTFAEPAYQSRVQGDAGDDRAADASIITDARTPRAGESVPQLLAELPGVTITRVGGAGSLAMISLRGSTWEQVGVYLDGVPLNSAQGGGVDLSTLPIGDVERIEVYRGSSPIAFGSSALGGVVSVTTRAPQQTGATAEAGIGSFATYAAGASASFAAPRLRLYVGAHYLGSANDFLFLSDSGTPFDTSGQHEVRRSNAAVVQGDGVLRAVLPLSVGRELTASLLVFFREQGLPGYGSVRQTTRTSLETLRTIASVAYDSRVDLRGGRVRAQVYCVYERDRYRDPLAEISIVPQATRDQTRTVGASLHLSRPIGSWLRLAVVAEGRYDLFEPYDADSKPAYGSPGTRLFGGAGAEADFWWKRPRLHIVPSARVEVARDERSGRDSFAMLMPDGPPLTNVVPIGRVALASQLTERVSLRANAARYARLPSLSELYGDSGFVVGNPALRPESGWTFDLGVGARVGRPRLGAKLDLTGFGSFVGDLIEYQQDAYGRARAVNLGRARILGVEVAVDAQLTRYARLLVNGAFTDARDVSDTSLGRRAPLLPNRPRLRLYARPEGRVPLPRGYAIGAYTDVDVMDGNYLDPANLVGLPTRVLVGAGVFVEVMRGQLTFIASARNLGDAHVFDFAGFPLPSRSFFATVVFDSKKEIPQ